MLTLTQLVVCHKEFLKLSFSLLLFIMLSVLLLFSSYCIMIQQENVEKISAYECGFQPFEDTRIKFDVRYYLVGILFPISDPEIMFLFPWSLICLEVGVFSLFVVSLFILLLFVGFFYEWFKGALLWE